ncbi:MAG: cyclase [Mycobacterium sp.]|nr:cyclase [Mycobacterium sp.]
MVIEAPPEAILDAIADVEAIPSWSSVHRHAEVLDTYADGRPHHVKVTVKVMGIVDQEVLEYHWGPNWVVWDAERTAQQHAQHVEYNLRREGDGTRVRFDITLEPAAPLPNFLIKRAKKTVLLAATEGLRQRVLG